MKYKISIETKQYAVIHRERKQIVNTLNSNGKWL